MKSPYLETEIKLPVSDLASVRRRLRQLGFRRIQPRRFEQNSVWDTRSRSLQKRGVLLRLRVEGKPGGLITVKGPRKRQRGFKVRTEWEMEISSAEAEEAILAELGYQVVFRYEKYRTTFGRKSRGRNEGFVLVDETPIGNFLELEGRKGWIQKVSRELGFGPEEALTESYGSLYAKWRREHPGSSKHMIFQE